MSRTSRWARNAVLALCGLVILMVIYLWLRTSTYTISRSGGKDVVLGRHAAERAVGALFTGRQTAFWTPSRRQIRSIEAGLRDYVAQSEPAALTQLEKGRRQYIGFFRDGQERVYIVGYCSTDDSDPRREFVPFVGNGECRFEAEYDLETRRVVRFWFGVPGD
ncbi:MAG: hypothetical protein H5T69_06675 [Chloroflexi bacterium]|nr:hypothetical protein [Chloroflexota bacterium]